MLHVTLPRSGRRRAAGVALALAATLALAGCSGSSAGSSTSAGEAAAPAADSAAGGASVSGADNGAGAAVATPQDQSVERTDAQGKGEQSVSAQGNVAGVNPNAGRRIRTADITLTVKDLSTAAAQVRAIADSLGGFVSSETTGVSEAVTVEDQAAGKPRSVQSGQSVMVLRVPVADLDNALGRVVKVGKEVSRSQTDQDVTGEIADTASRIETQKASVARTRELLAKANTVQDIVFIEGELTKREADLEALQARLKSLSDRADFSTLTVTLQVPGVETVTQPEPSTGFLAGLRQGWDALVASTNVVLMVLGALLPVAIVLIVVGYPASVLLRRRSQRQTAEREAAAARWVAAQQPAPPSQVPVMAGAPAQQPSDAGPGTGTGATPQP